MIAPQPCWHPSNKGPQCLEILGAAMTVDARHGGDAPTRLVCAAALRAMAFRLDQGDRHRRGVAADLRAIAIELEAMK